MLPLAPRMKCTSGWVYAASRAAGHPGTRHTRKHSARCMPQLLSMPVHLQCHCSLVVLPASLRRLLTTTCASSLRCWHRKLAGAPCWRGRQRRFEARMPTAAAPSRKTLEGDPAEGVMDASLRLARCPLMGACALLLRDTNRQTLTELLRGDRAVAILVEQGEGLLELSDLKRDGEAELPGIDGVAQAR